jgi:predicted nicotinamide N-methyase
MDFVEGNKFFLEDWKNTIFPVKDENNKTEAEPGSRLGVSYSRSIKDSIPISICLPSSNASSSSTLELEISQVSMGPMAISSVVWDAGLYLIDFLETNAHSGRPDRLQLGKTLELGTGTGIGGIAAACLGATTTVLSDIAEPAVMQDNIDTLPEALGSTISFIAYDWSAPDIPPGLLNGPDREGWDTVLCSDVLYDVKYHKPLLQLLRRLCSSEYDPDSDSNNPPSASPSPDRHPFRRMILSYKLRHEVPEQAFFESLEEWCHLRVLDSSSMTSACMKNSLRNNSSLHDLFVIVAEPLSLEATD